MSLKEFITARNIIMDFNASSKKEAIEKLAILLFENGDLIDKNEFIQAVFERESYTTTGIGNHLAIPHGKGSTVKKATLIFAKAQQPINWGSLDGEPVDIIFLMAIPQTDNGTDHLRMLAELSGRLMDDSFIEKIREETSVDRLVKLLSN
ncbi:PTS sugar transporter subunit IIA [Enterococcus sp. JM9B]|uniref:PTS sugar transporter subunit IIA n=1 Tax=Enterococcus sp. JM9B TaxID=1857216 RepID=UPI001374B1C7|nr:fructose PTS transporter subunit IIA [Enterococcus sp. JM9B]KAF1300855.1 PTS mannose transporter subunit IIAB [Enterococcus sp. JM9B]